MRYLKTLLVLGLMAMSGFVQGQEEYLIDALPSDRQQMFLSDGRLTDSFLNVLKFFRNDDLVNHQIGYGQLLGDRYFELVQLPGVGELFNMKISELVKELANKDNTVFVPEFVSLRRIFLFLVLKDIRAVSLEAQRIAESGENLERFFKGFQYVNNRSWIEDKYLFIPSEGLEQVRQSTNTLLKNREFVGKNVYSTILDQTIMLATAFPARTDIQSTFDFNDDEFRKVETIIISRYPFSTKVGRKLKADLLDVKTLEDLIGITRKIVRHYEYVRRNGWPEHVSCMDFPSAADVMSAYDRVKKDKNPLNVLLFLKTNRIHLDPASVESVRKILDNPKYKKFFRKLGKRNRKIFKEFMEEELPYLKDDSVLEKYKSIEKEVDVIKWILGEKIGDIYQHNWPDYTSKKLVEIVLKDHSLYTLRKVADLSTSERFSRLYCQWEGALLMSLIKKPSGMSESVFQVFQFQAVIVALEKFEMLDVDYDSISTNILRPLELIWGPLRITASERDILISKLNGAISKVAASEENRRISLLIRLKALRDQLQASLDTRRSGLPGFILGKSVRSVRLLLACLEKS